MATATLKHATVKRDDLLKTLKKKQEKERATIRKDAERKRADMIRSWRKFTTKLSRAVESEKWDDVNQLFDRIYGRGSGNCAGDVGRIPKVPLNPKTAFDSLVSLFEKAEEDMVKLTESEVDYYGI